MFAQDAPEKRTEDNTLLTAAITTCLEENCLQLKDTFAENCD